jgi:hypothetical protein
MELRRRESDGDIDIPDGIEKIAGGANVSLFFSFSAGHFLFSQ